MIDATFLRIFTLAVQLEPDRRAVWEWLRQAPIATLGDQTAWQLLRSGRGQEVVNLLEAALRDEAAEVDNGYPFSSNRYRGERIRASSAV